MTTIGSLFSGAGGLEMGVQAVLGGDVAWHCEFDQAASKVLAHHDPEVPNLGDVTAVYWSQVTPVDVLCGGSPCQDVSAAGRRAGMRAGTRSGLWASMCDAIEVIRPRLVVWENVRGVLSAEADSDLEPCAGCVGDGDDGPVLRAFGRVLGDLAELGFDAVWCGLRAADVGAPHGRFRVFVLAAARDTDGGDSGRWSAAGLAGQAGSAAGPVADPGGGELQRRGVGGVVAGPEGAGEGEGPQRQRDRHAAGDGGATVANTSGDGRHEGRPESAGQLGGLDAAERSGQPVADADADGFGSVRGRGSRGRRDGSADHDQPALDWGQFEPAVRRWESVIGRLAPAPTVPGTRSAAVLNPSFVEWMMGLPAGHVTDVPGISRNDQLKILGNGVVPQQAAAALRWLLPQLQSESAAGVAA